MKVLFVYQKPISFIEKDLAILRSAHEVRQCRFTGIQDLPELARGVAWCDMTFSWFAKLHAFFAVLLSNLLRKKAVVVAGGDDVAVVKAPGFKYGMYAFWWKRWCPSFALRNADLVLAVSEYNRNETISNAGAKPEKVKLIYHGFDASDFSCAGSKESAGVISVGSIDRERTERKGYRLLVQGAGSLPQAKFDLVGDWVDGSVAYLKSIASENVHFLGRVSDNELRQLVGKAKVYAQLSLHEAFGCSLAEAMLCECVPVVSRRAAIPEVVGDCGFYVDSLEPEAAAEAIRKALDAPSDLGRRARERIRTLYPMEKRRKELLEAIAALAGPVPACGEP